MSVRLEPGAIAPDFTLPAAGGDQVALSQQQGRVIVYFYPAAMTPGCTVQAVDFTGAIKDLAAAGFSVLGISPDPVAKLEKFQAAEDITFPLLSDTERTVLQAWGAYGEKKLYGKVVEGVIRSTFVVNVTDGVATVELAQYNVRAKGHVDKLRRDLGI
ncbi:peroxiredoxin [Parenemella sanctibonifatiensis]|uniref:thioredoxin-dependent peroxiredoxin n=1 Tax=Parenemella sanctibonifatiensis TaxID=2016505 RepID=A0A255ELP5_9ACTN|nr:peroxiredoxin [Parenemella sanctibonifatiensis]OYN87839.1 peroxiredoxin [Parenemella sanctibonifatiensis]OYN92140.1 peroxiredoxin [Parenemella sanctibonifatiensis]